jgi:hypothetical protein
MEWIYWMLIGGLGLILGGCSSPSGLNFSRQFSAKKVEFLADETWVDSSGNLQVKQEIFDSVFKMIDQADRFVLIDLFLMNNFGYRPASGMREMSTELADKLIAKRKNQPRVKIVFITDPVNSVYGSIANPLFSKMQDAGIEVVWTDLDQLRDSNPGFSILWRMLVKPFGVGPGRMVPNPLGEGRISMRSFLKMLNFKANHRKVIITDKALLVTSANPHSASSAHWNVALRIDGAGIEEACLAESAVLKLSNAKPFKPAKIKEVQGPYRLELLTEIKIKKKVLALLNGAEKGAKVDLCMFYLSEAEVIAALIDAQKRGVALRVILDPSKDAFGRTKNGVPNRQSAVKLVAAGIPVRWANTHGEQCHAKVLYVEQKKERATLLLGSGNYTTRNLDDYNLECDVALETKRSDPNMKKFRTVFNRWWFNQDGHSYTVEYSVYEDRGLGHQFLSWFMEKTGMGTF